MDAEARGRFSRWIPWLGGFVVALPTLLVAYPPSTDLPYHEGLVGLLRHWGDDRYLPKGLYLWNPGHPNQLFYYMSAAFALVGGTAFGVKLTIACSQVGIFVGGGRLARRLGTTPWVSLLLAPVALGWMYFWGLVSNLLGMALLFNVLPTLDDWAKKPTLVRAFGIVLLLAFLSFAHESAMALAIVMIGILLFAYPLHWPETVLRALPIPIIGAIFVFDWTYAAKVATRAAKYGSVIETISFWSPLKKIIWAPAAMFGSHEEYARIGLMALALIGALAFALPRFAVPWPRPKGLSNFVHAYRFELYGLALLFCYFVMPWGARGTTLLHQRFFAPAYTIIAISFSARDFTPRQLRLAAGTALSGIIALFLSVFPQFAEAHHAYSELQVLLDKIPLNTATFALEFDAVKGTSRIFSVSTASGRVLAERGGRTNWSFVTSPLAPVTLNAEFGWFNADLRMRGNTLNIVPPVDLRYYRYVLVHSREPLFMLATLTELEPEAEIIQIQGEFALLKSKLPAEPILAPDWKTPKGLPTLKKRVQDRLSDSLRVRYEADLAAGKIAPILSNEPAPYPGASEEGRPTEPAPAPSGAEAQPGANP